MAACSFKPLFEDDARVCMCVYMRGAGCVCVGGVSVQFVFTLRLARVSILFVFACSSLCVLSVCVSGCVSLCALICVL